MVERFKQVRDGRLGWGLAPRSSGDLCRYSDYAALERQIAELRAELAKAASRQQENFSEVGRLTSYCHNVNARAEAAEAENARLRALPLKDEVERVLEPFADKNVLEAYEDGSWVDCAFTARQIRDAQTLLSRLRAGEQEWWRSMDSAPVGVDILVGGDLGHGWKSHVYQIRDEFWREDWEDEPTHWMPLPAAPSEQGGDRP